MKEVNNAGYRQVQPVALKRVAVKRGFWAERLRINREVTVPLEYEKCKETGRIDSLRLTWRPGQPNPPHHFWDSDIAKWIEAAAYTLATEPDPELEARVDAVIDLLAAAQQPDGYLNTYYTVVEPGKRWTNLRDMHELYCAGHLIEAAVAYAQATGKDKLLGVMRRYADHIASVFGPNPGQKRGYPGHEEIELALVKLYRFTGERRYLDLAAFFVNERGRRPHYFDSEARARGEDPQSYRWRDHTYTQSHLPVREQRTAEGHAVRAMYLYSGMTDVGVEMGDETLLEACRVLWRNVVQRRMYVTGGVGSAAYGERFTADYDLPNEFAYAETCAAIGLVLWAHRMLQAELDAQYADVMELALYNGALSGVSLGGDLFFYANPLEVHPERFSYRSELSSSAVTPRRQPWFGCACCPMNIARLIASVGQYIYSVEDRAAYVHLFVDSSVDLQVAGQKIRLRQETEYPWEGDVRLYLSLLEPTEFTLGLRVPGWAGSVRISVNGVPCEVPLQKGYARIDRIWQDGDRVTFSLPMRIRRLSAHPAVYENCGRVALQRGPLIYCLEEVDNGRNLRDIVLPRDAELCARFEPELLGGVVTINGTALRSDLSSWDSHLYRPFRGKAQEIALKAVPYFAWANREAGEMLVWIREA